MITIRESARQALYALRRSQPRRTNRMLCQRSCHIHKGITSWGRFYIDRQKSKIQRQDWEWTSVSNLQGNALWVEIVRLRLTGSRPYDMNELQPVSVQFTGSVLIRTPRLVGACQCSLSTSPLSPCCSYLVLSLTYLIIIIVCTIVLQQHYHYCNTT